MSISVHDGRQWTLVDTLAGNETSSCRDQRVTFSPIEHLHNGVEIAPYDGS